MTRADSAGRPFAGRAFDPAPTAFGGDDGSAPPAFVAALAAFRGAEQPVEHVVAALRDARLLVPLLADLGEAGEVAGRHADKRAELALVTVAGPDGRRVLPAFSSADAMRAWNPAARPVPAPARQVALGAAADGTELVVVDPGPEQPFVLRRSALEALARDLPWTAPWRDPEVVAALRAAAAGEPAVAAVRAGPGDPASTLAGPEVQVVLSVHAGLDADAVAGLGARLRQRWSEQPVIRERVDSLGVRLELAGAC